MFTKLGVAVHSFYFKQVRPSRRTRVFMVPSATALIILVLSGPLAHAQSRYDDARGLVSRVIQDLGHAEGMASHRKHSKENQRIDTALRHLSDFDRSLSKGKFDHGRLDRAVSDLQSVLDHNTLSPEDRDNLNADLRDLRSMRSSRGR